MMWKTTCPACKAEDHLYVQSFVAESTEIPLRSDGFSTQDAKWLDTTEVAVFCAECGSSFELEDLEEGAAGDPQDTVESIFNESMDVLSRLLEDGNGNRYDLMHAELQALDLIEKMRRFLQSNVDRVFVQMPRRAVEQFRVVDGALRFHGETVWNSQAGREVAEWTVDSVNAGGFFVTRPGLTHYISRDRAFSNRQAAEADKKDRGEQ